MNLGDIPCEEASPRSRETFIPCGAPGEMLVWHQKDRRAYVMCLGCGTHNVRNRGGVQLVASSGEKATIIEAGTIPVANEDDIEALPRAVLIQFQTVEELNAALREPISTVRLCWPDGAVVVKPKI